MANTYTQIHIHAVFAVQNRQSLIHDSWKDELYKYITGIITNSGNKLLIINGVEDHIHILFGLRPTTSLSEIIQSTKGGSSTWINNKGLVHGKFSWQSGYGAFSLSKSQLPNTVRYIKDQKTHHAKILFQTEYIKLLKKIDIDYDERYIFTNPL